MKVRWLGVLFLLIVFLFTLTVLSVSANSTNRAMSSAPKLLRRCENNYDDDELQAIWDNGDDGYEPDDCPLLAHPLTGPMLLNFCQPGDEDWIKFKAQPNLLYQIRAEPIWNYPTEPKMELYVDGVLAAQNDHYFDRNAEIWWWNSAKVQVVYLRMTELAGRHDCGNSAYTLSLNAFQENPYPSTPMPTVTPTITMTVAITATLAPTATVTATLTPTLTITPTLLVTETPTATIVPGK